jgi:hypothetical protein
LQLALSSQASSQLHCACWSSARRHRISCLFKVNSQASTLMGPFFKLFALLVVSILPSCTQLSLRLVQDGIWTGSIFQLTFQVARGFYSSLAQVTVSHLRQSSFRIGSIASQLDSSDFCRSLLCVLAGLVYTRLVHPVHQFLTFHGSVFQAVDGMICTEIAIACRIMYSIKSIHGFHRSESLAL